MDLRDHSRGRARASARNKQIEQFNQQLDVMKRQAASQAAGAEAQAQQTGIQREEKDAIVGAFAVKGGIADMGAALKGAGKGTVETIAKDALEAGKAGKSMVEAGAKSTDKLLGEGTAAKLAKAGEKSGLTATLKDKGEKFAASAVGKKLGAATEAGMAHTGALVNIGLGAYDVAEDFKGGHFQLKGDNDAEKTANALQIGAGVADAIGFVFPPAFVIGAALGVASSAADVIGSGQAAEEKVNTEKSDETKAEASLESQKEQIQNEVVETTTTLASA